MKIIFATAQKSYSTLFLFFTLLFFSLNVSAQTIDSTHLYGLSKSGMIYLIDTSNAQCSSAINPKFPKKDSAIEANAMGYDSANHNFYFFKRNFLDAPEEFVSYNIDTKQYTQLAASPITANVYRGCINPEGTGYYCLDQNSNLCYYDINAGTWTLITSNFVDDSDVYFTPIFAAYPSGDMAFDSEGNLWLLYSTGYQYGLCRMDAPFPTTAVDTIKMHQVIGDTTFTPTLIYPFGGIAFSGSGQIYLSTGSPDNHLYLLQSDHSLLSIGILSADGAGTDLTSDIFPVSELPVTFLNFDGVLRNDEAALNWSTSAERNNKGFEVQRSTNAQTFTAIGFVNADVSGAAVKNYSFSDPKLVSGNNYYRLKQIDLDGKYSYSSVIKLAFNKFDWSILGNPSGNMWMQLQLDKMHDVSVEIISMQGNILQTIRKGNIGAGTYSIPLDVSHFAKGMYVVKLIVDDKIYSKNVLK